MVRSMVLLSVLSADHLLRNVAMVFGMLNDFSFIANIVLVVAVKASASIPDVAYEMSVATAAPNPPNGGIRSRFRRIFMSKPSAVLLKARSCRFCNTNQGPLAIPNATKGSAQM